MGDVASSNQTSQPNNKVTDQALPAKSIQQQAIGLVVSVIVCFAAAGIGGFATAVQRE